MNDGTIEIVRFPITPDTNLCRHGTHNGLRYKISNHARYKADGFYDRGRENGTWCYYVYIPEYMLPPSQFEKFWLPAKPDGYQSSSGVFHPHYDYNGPNWSDCEWHGGVTWYAKLGGLDGAPRVVEIGCDYAHLWDAEREYRYSYAEIESAAKHTIDELCDLYQFFVPCCYTGKCLPKSEMVEHEGRFYTKKGLEEWLAFKTEKVA